MNYLCKEGHKVSQSKVQLCLPQVEYLGFTLTPGERKISSARVKAVVGMAHPLTKKDMLSFLGMIGYCCQWIPDCSHFDNILGQSTLTEARDLVTWDDEKIHTYARLKTAMVTAPGLGLPDYCKYFHLYTRDNCKSMAAVLAKDYGAKLRPVAFFSNWFRYKACLRTPRACTMGIEMSAMVTLGHATHLHTSHQVLLLLKNLNTTLTPNMLMELSMILVESGSSEALWQQMVNQFPILLL